MIILTLGSSWYLSMWSMKVVPGYLSPPIAIPSYTPFVFSDMMLFNSLDIPPDRETYATLLGRNEFSNFKVHLLRTYFLQILFLEIHFQQLHTSQAWRALMPGCCPTFLLCFQFWNSPASLLQPEMNSSFAVYV